MIRRVNKFIDQYNLLADCDVLYAAVSGGADSVCMLYILNEICKSRGIILSCCHVNHMLRGADSDNDEVSVVLHCMDLYVHCYLHKQDVKEVANNKGISIEAAAREVRYSCFNDIIKYNNKRILIATAHTANDNAETVLLNLIRGTGAKGLSGIPVKRDRIIRPLLCLSREDTEKYCRDNGISFVTDKSNFDTIYSRNKIRLEVLPLLSQINTEAVGNICKAASFLDADTRFIEGIADTEYEKAFSNGALKVTEIKNIHDAVLNRIIVRYIKENCKCDYDSLRINNINKLIREGVTGKKTQIADNMYLEISYDKLIISPNKENECFIYAEVTGPGEYKFGNKTVVIEESNTRSSKINSIDYNKITFPLVLKTYQKGDKFKIVSVGTKLVNRLFTDRKIPLSERSSLPMLLCNEEVAWIMKIGASENYKTDMNTKKYINITIKENTL